MLLPACAFCFYFCPMENDGVKHNICIVSPSFTDSSLIHITEGLSTTFPFS